MFVIFVFIFVWYGVLLGVFRFFFVFKGEDFVISFCFFFIGDGFVVGLLFIGESLGLELRRG